MIYISIFLLLFFSFFLLASPVHAIIVMIPAVLIPIVNIVVWIIGAIAVPVVAISTYFFKIRQKNIFVGIIVGVLILLLLALVITFGIKLLDPDRPIYSNNF